MTHSHKFIPNNFIIWVDSHQYFFCFSNVISGSIPGTAGKREKLQTLDLSNNNSHSWIPDSKSSRSSSTTRHYIRIFSEERNKESAFSCFFPINIKLNLCNNIYQLCILSSNMLFGSMCVYFFIINLKFLFNLINLIILV